MSTKEKGDILENVLEQMCSQIQNAKITRNAKIQGKKSETLRDVDVLIEGTIGAFDVKIAVESRNYAEPIGVDKIEGLKSKLDDIDVDLGVMICPTGFTEPARNMAAFDGIQLFEVFDPVLGNSNLFIPLRYITSKIDKYAFTAQTRVPGPFSIPQDVQRWRIHVGENLLTAEELLDDAWDKDLIPKTKGTHRVNLNTVSLSEVDTPGSLIYCELLVDVIVGEDYYLSIIPASFLQNIGNGKKNFNLPVNLYSTDEDMLNNGWKKFTTEEEMNMAADIENQPADVRGLIMRHARPADPL